MADRTVRFYYEFASTYSYLSAMRIEEMAAARQVAIDWKPFLLGPIFKDQGYDTSPFNIYREKGRYMWRDIKRLADARGLPFSKPDPFPQNGLMAARLALAGQVHREDREQSWTPQFTRAIYTAEFGEGRNIADPAVLRDVLDSLGLDPAPIFEAAESDAVKLALRNNVNSARAHHIFGAPSFVAPDGEMFWGNDRLEAALDWTNAPGSGC